MVTVTSGGSQVEVAQNKQGKLATASSSSGNNNINRRTSESNSTAASPTGSITGAHRPHPVIVAHNSLAPSSLPASPRLVDSENKETTQSNMLLNEPGAVSMGISGSSNGSTTSQTSSSVNRSDSRAQASSSSITMPAPVQSNGVSTTSQHSSPAQRAAVQTATAAAFAATQAAAAASSQHYRNYASLHPNSSSSSSPSSSAQLAMQNQYLSYQHLHQQMAYETYTVDLTNCIIGFLSPILPTEEEYRIKEATRRQLERLANRVSSGAKLLAFGSMANGFALRNSDMDLCCLIAPTESEAQKALAPSASELVEVLGKLVREETDYTVMPLPKARIPIIKIRRAPTAELPYEISCDIGFENRTALENTRLLLTYAMVDPPRLRTLVLFLKVWTKRRKLNSPYTGTLSSYGYTLMMIFFLSHIKRPAVLPNLQRIIPSSTSKRPEKVTTNGHDIYFYDDVATLRKEWSSVNTENVAELLIDFFRYFSKDFSYSRDVISIRTETGLMAKDANVWSAELCIEDPFQTGYNVARTVTRDGLYTIRGEFMRASRILSTMRIGRVSQTLAELCEEREDGLTRAPDVPFHQRHHRASFAAASPSGAAPMAMHHAPPAGYDSRYLRDLTRRYDLQGNSATGLGGSFAFEEMARGLGQAQKSSNMVAYPPTTAMLAPLSQNTGLSPRQHLMRAGLRYETPRRMQSGSMANGIPNVMPGSSARSEDGGSNYESKRSKKGVISKNVSARTSPNLDNAVAAPLLHPNSAATTQGNGLGVVEGGETSVYGSEISFGSQRFQLHPHPSTSSQANGGTIIDSSEDKQRNSRSFSDGINRSMSLPRSSMEANEVRRSSTPLLSEPASPNNMLRRAALPEPQGKFLEPAMASLSLHHNSQRSSSPRSSISGSSSGRQARLALVAGLASRRHADDVKAQASQQSSSSPQVPPSPWSLAEDDQHSQNGQAIMTPEDEGSFGLDDEPASLSDVDETTARLDTASQDEANSVREESLSLGKEHAIRSWAASQSAGLHEHLSSSSSPSLTIPSEKGDESVTIRVKR